MPSRAISFRDVTRRARQASVDLQLDATAALGADALALAASTEDFRTGAKAFLDKAADRRFRGC